MTDPLGLASRLQDHCESGELPVAVAMDCAEAARLIIRTFVGPARPDVAMTPLSPVALAGLRALGVVD